MSLPPAPGAGTGGPGAGPVSSTTGSTTTGGGGGADSGSLAHALSVSVARYLSVDMCDNALFLAERLCALRPQSADALCLHAQCLYRMGKIAQCRMLLMEGAGGAAGGGGARANGGQHMLGEQGRLLLAQCCLQLHRYREGERTLLGGRDRLLSMQAAQVRGECKQEVLRTVPCAAAGLFVMGMVSKRQHRLPIAMEFFRLALEADPFCFEAWKEVCDLGGTIAAGDDAQAVFADTNVETAVLATLRGMGAGGVGSQQFPQMFPPHLQPQPQSQIQPVQQQLQQQPQQQQHASAAGAVRTVQRHSHHHGATGGGGTSFSTPGLTPISAQQEHNSTMVSMHHLDSSLPQRFSRGGRLSFSSAAEHPSMQPQQQQQQQQQHYVPDPNLPPLPPSTSSASSSTSSSSMAAAAAAATSAQQQHSTPFGSEAHVGFLMHGQPPEAIAESVGNGVAVVGTDGSATQTPVHPAHPSQATGIVQSGGAGRTADAEALQTASPAVGTNAGHPATRSVGHSHKKIRFDNGGATDTPASIVVREDSPPEEEREQQERDEGDDAHAEQASIQLGCLAMLRLLRMFGNAYALVASYKCADALSVLRKFPREHLRSAWTQQMIGRACFEVARYKEALQAYREMRRLAPYRLAGTEIMSTALWHMRKERELCTLAQEVVNLDRMATETWCVVGNCFSMQREHEAAIGFFKRALQLDPHAVYASTLCGHEYVANEELDLAIAAFRTASNENPRHYNAWYGLGTIYFRQEKYDIAEYHFRRAITINPWNTVLHCHLGMVLHANNKSSTALDVLSKACALDKRNVQCYFQRANVLVALQRDQEAVRDLRRTLQLAPKEAVVHFLLGQALKRLGRRSDAVLHLNVALDLQPQDNAVYKAALEAIDDEDAENEGCDPNISNKSGDSSGTGGGDGSGRRRRSGRSGAAGGGVAR